ncbi:MAG: Protein AmpG [Stenotrophomonas maltophilia]|nr:MAG: Protein AmpG [Stenotrophomonas maltophilia]
MDSLLAEHPVDEVPAKSAQRQVLGLLLGLYIAQGIPVGLAFQAYPTLLRNLGASLDLIALTPLATLPWVAKLFWAALIENRWSPRLGRRRSWIVPLQAGSVLALLGMALVPFTVASMGLLLGFIALLSLFCASQDVAVDGLAADRLPSSGLGQVNVLQVGGFLLGMLLGGPGTLMLFEQCPPSVVFICLAGAMLLCSLPVLFWREPAPVAALPRARLWQFFRRRHALRMTVLTLLVALAGSVFFGLARLILVDAGWSLGQVGALTGIGQLLTILLGCLAAAWLLGRFNCWTTLLVGFALLAVAGLIWVDLAVQPQQAEAWRVGLGLVIGGLGTGVVSVASYTLGMRYAQQGAQPGTDFSVFQGLQTLGEILITSLALGVAAHWGYASGLGVGLLALGLALLQALFVRRSTAAQPLD